ncbi:MAG TPA: DUF971 domain-containing protein [Dongiaceae bacterium]|jgi:DUF971 family protein|nr:DUF971 domain-containing protein [Dongiaceae bacterium]
MITPPPREVRLIRAERVLQVTFAEDVAFRLPAEYLRVFSPSAEVQGHGAAQKVLVLGKENVAIRDIERIGHYAIRLIFDDGHDSGIYSWAYLRELGENQQANLREYRNKVAQIRQST